MIWRGEGGIAIQTKITAACKFISSSDSTLHWLDLCRGGVWSHSWDHTEFANQSSVEWMWQPPVNHNLLNRCSVILHMVPRWCCQNAYGTRKCNIYAKVCNERDPWQIYHYSSWLSDMHLHTDLHVYSHINQHEICTPQRPVHHTDSENAQYAT